MNTSLRVRTDADLVARTDPSQAGVGFIRDANGQVVGVIGSITPAGQRIPPGQELFVRFSGSQTLTGADGKPAKSAGSKTGIGDISLRTKYRVFGDSLGGIALGLNLTLPSGDEDNFHGTGETHLSTFVYLSQVLGERFEPHLNLGVDFNADDVDRSSFLS